MIIAVTPQGKQKAVYMDTYPHIHRFAVASDGEVYAAGSTLDTSTLRLVGWVGTVSNTGVEDLSETFDGAVFALTASPVLCVGGNFRRCGTTMTGPLACWDGERWQGVHQWTHAWDAWRTVFLLRGALTTLMESGDVRLSHAVWRKARYGIQAIAGEDQSLYVSGWVKGRKSESHFVMAMKAQQGLSGIAYSNGPIQSIAITRDGNPVIGGEFTQLGRAEIAHVAILQDGEWRPLGSLPKPVHHLVVWDSLLFASCRDPDSINVKSLLQYNSGCWEPVLLPETMNSFVSGIKALTSGEDGLYVAFTTDDQQAKVYRLGRNGWEQIFAMKSSLITALTLSSYGLLIAGDFYPLRQP